MAYRFKHGDRPLEGYTIQRGVGRGGFGEVYYAVSDGGREVALKYLRENPELELRGVSQCMNLKSPHLVTIFDVKKSAEGEYFIVMEYVSGPSLRDLLVAESNGLGSQKAAYFVREIAKGLAYLHDRGIVHRDMKPGNIFYEDGYVKIGDYGLSKFISVSRHSAQTASIGTVHYMAPEVGSGDYSRGIDIYAVGVILYEMLLGKVPFEGSSMGEVLMKHLTEQPEVDELPAPFGKVIRKALAKDPKSRYQTVDEMVDELFDVDDVRQSVGGFNPVSLSGVARRAAGDLVDSPVPSPNPQRGPAPMHGGANHPVPPAIPVSPAAGAAHEWVGRRPEGMSARLDKRLERINRKMEKKLDKLAGGRRKRNIPPPPPAGTDGHGADGERLPDLVALVADDPTEQAKRIVLAAMMACGLAVGVGFLIATQHHDGLATGIIAAVSTALMAAGVTTGVVLSRWMVISKIRPNNRTWVTRIVTVVCCLPMMLVGAIPILAMANEAPAVLGALAIAVALARWDERLRRGIAGDLHVGMAIILGCVTAAIAAAMDAEVFSAMAGGVAGAASLAVQAIAPVWPIHAAATRSRPRRRERHRDQQHDAGAAPVRLPDAPDAAFAARGDLAETVQLGDHPASIPLGIPVEERYRGVGLASNAPLPKLRSGFARGFWSLVAFLLAGGMIATFVIPLVTDFNKTYMVEVDGKWVHRSAGTDYETYFGMIVGCVACFSLLIFALRKATQRKRQGFWRETLRPFLTAASMTGMGACIAALSVPEIIGDVKDDRIGVIVGLVFSSLLFLVLLFARGRRARPAFVAGEYRPFVEAHPAPATPSPQKTPADVASPE